MRLPAATGRRREAEQQYEAPFARALLALSGHALGEAGDALALDEALEDLRVADAKLHPRALASPLTPVIPRSPGRAGRRGIRRH